MQWFRSDRAALLAALLLVIGISGFAQDSGNSHDVSCAPPPGAASLWGRTDVRFLVIGEMHGTREMPEVFGELVCSAATQARRRILVGLEFPEAAQAAFETYLASKGAAGDRREFLAESGWQDMVRQYPDGRTSDAMLEMIERLRTLRAAGHPIFVTTFIRQLSAAGESQTPYEIGLADSLRAAFASGAYDLAIVLAGNLHARRMTVTLAGVPPFDPMAMHLPQEATLTLNAVTAGGEAWYCQSTDCGIHKRQGHPLGATPGIALGANLSPGYDGIIALGPVTASPPPLESHDEQGWR